MLRRVAGQGRPAALPTHGHTRPRGRGDGSGTGCRLGYLVPAPTLGSEAAWGAGLAPTPSRP